MFLSRRVKCLLAMMLISIHSPLYGADLTIEKARIRELIPGQNKTVAYLDITNEGTVKVALVGVVSDSVGRIEMHTIVNNRDMVRMQQLSEVDLPPGETIRFRSGGLHLMVLDVMELSQETEIHLITSDGDSHRTVLQRVSLLDSLVTE